MYLGLSFCPIWYLKELKDIEGGELCAGEVTVFSVPQKIFARRGLGDSEGVNFLIGLHLGWGLNFDAPRILCLNCWIGMSEKGDLTGVGV